MSNFNPHELRAPTWNRLETLAKHLVDAQKVDDSGIHPSDPRSLSTLH